MGQETVTVPWGGCNGCAASLTSFPFSEGKALGGGRLFCKQMGWALAVTSVWSGLRQGQAAQLPCSLRVVSVICTAGRRQRGGCLDRRSLA